ncbi:MAG: hypothetical protein PWQ29_1429 [Verrucomicrobiota bacterium]|jgi:predicted GH43/DUF377 family glycosyl hydrolase|nr:hypothetical protein [Verrucomicrobiota bacterium]
MALELVRHDIDISRDTARVLARPHIPGNPARIRNIIDRVLKLPLPAVRYEVDKVMNEFSWRHHRIECVLLSNFDAVRNYFPENICPSPEQRLLIGACFTMEYAIESAALFNPAIVPHPDQTGLKSGQLRFIMSLRATGEGHISSIVFRSGIIGPDGSLALNPTSKIIDTPDLQLNSTYEKHLFELKLNEMRVCSETTAWVLSRLNEFFSFEELMRCIACFRAQFRPAAANQTECLHLMEWLARSNYETRFSPSIPISGRVVFPVSENESSGIEDARFVKFYEDSGESRYYATYTAYNGHSILPQLIETSDFETFRIITMNGKAVQNKGMALFPRRINGQYAMLSRQDGENNYIMFSDHMHFWQKAQLLQYPESTWEFVQIGNCGSPLETDEGWLVLTHGVGPMRKYSIGAILLDLEAPARIIARLDEPLMTPQEDEREGYVPNVLYSCGALIHNGQLILPYAMSDIRTRVATVSVENLLRSMSRC